MNGSTEGILCLWKVNDAMLLLIASVGYVGSGIKYLRQTNALPMLMEHKSSISKEVTESSLATLLSRSIAAHSNKTITKIVPPFI